MKGQERQQRLRIKVIGVIVAAGDEITIHAARSQNPRVNNSLSDTNVWFVGIGVFLRQRIREIWIEKNGVIILGDEEAALAEPPDAAAAALKDAKDIGKESVVLSESGFHV